MTPHPDNYPDLGDVFTEPVFGVSTENKRSRLLKLLQSLTSWHAERCPPYSRLLKAMGADYSNAKTVEQLPFVPVRLFKNLELKSVPDLEIIRVLTSSGTTDSNVARIVLDKETARRQSVALTQIMGSFIGKSRIPMLVVDTPSQSVNKGMLSARGAGIIGLSLFGRDHQYALKDDMSLDEEGIRRFSEKFGKGPVLLFGFTFVVWEYFYEALRKKGISYDWGKAVLVHSGGWKKMEKMGVPPRVFAEKLSEQLGIRKVHNFYGMAEQVGSVYMTCEYDRFHAPLYSDIIIRDESDWRPLPIHQPGIIQTISVLPASYPGHSLLTEDMGMITGVDDCPCGRLGTTFSISGRLPRSEVRGCSDVIASGVNAEGA